jgi:hypothetical protein
MGGFTQQLQNAELWPIKAKKQVTNWNPLGDPSVENFYHKSLEDGRALETSVTDANHWLIQRRNQINVDIQHMFDKVKLATDGKLDNPWRAIKYGYDVITFMQKVSAFEQETIALIQAMVKNVGIIQSMEQNILQSIQANLNAVASLLHDICNWALPDLPAIPNLFSDGIWHWNGFNFFPLSSFIPHPNFDVNFAFGQCNLHVPNVNILRNFPSTVQSYDGLTYGTPLFVPPLGGLIPNTGVNLSDPAFIAQMQGTTKVPYYTPDQAYPNYFNPNTSMQGSLPSPSTVISNYQMPSATYQQNVVSAVPSLLPDVVEPTDPDYTNPNYAVRQPTLRKDLVRYVTLGNVVDSNFDPNLTSAWVFYVSSSRGGRAGQWIANFEAAYQNYVQPSVTYLASNPIPWNQVLPGTVLASGPQALPLTLALMPGSSPPAFTEEQGNILWKLSYVEAAILGYPRNTTWDGYADNNYVGSFTGTDLDYAFVTIDPTSTVTVTLGEGEAAYPVSCTFPTAIAKAMAEVISTADTRIGLVATYQSVHPQNRYTYDQFAIASSVDKYTQFWRDFNYNLQSLLVQDTYIVGYVCGYADVLDSAIDPLGNPADYNAVMADASSRIRTWVPGFPLLAIPIAPIVVYSNSVLQNPNQTGWSGTSFDAASYLARPDIQGQSIPVQQAMLYCNVTAANLMSFKSQIANELNTAISSVQKQIQGASNFGFQVEVDNSPTDVPPGIAGALVAFDQVDFDLTGYVTSQTTFTITAAGAYVISGQLSWEAGAAGVRTVTIYLESSPPVVILTQSTDPSQTGPVALPFNATFNFNVGDVIQVWATHSLAADQTVGPGSLLSVIMYQSTPDVTPVVPPSPTSNGSATFVASVDMPPLTAVYVDSSGGVSPIDPTAVNMSSPPFVYDFYPYIDGVTLSAAQAGGPVTVAIGYGSVFQVPGAGWVAGGLLYAGAGGFSPTVDPGLLTQDYSGVILQNCSWVIVAGRALDDQTFVYEPHIPTRAIIAY